MNYIKEFSPFIKELTKVSSKTILEYFKKDVQIELKEDDSPVTIADKLAEEKMRAIIENNFPDHGIIGEEFGVKNEHAQYQWVLDPIDGTKSFIAGVPLFGTLIALTKNKQPVLGVIHLPATNDLLIGDNLAAYHNEKEIKLREIADINEAIMLYTNLHDIEKHQNINGFLNLTAKTKYSRTWGDCFGYFLLATGKADIMIDPVMSIWDITALVPVIKGAGGTITNYQGNDPVGAESCVAAAKSIHGEVIKILNKS
ncbi:MAG: histidinol-phosphatase [Spirochaetia bacterium]|nr:histidinol-phosphatase [Spirochaetia bacterium]